MANHPVRFSDIYTCKISGIEYRYDAEFTPGREVSWSARVYRDNVLKGTPSGSMFDNTMGVEALQRYLIAYIESVIEQGIGIDE